MVTRGPKPKPPKLRLVDGSHRPARHGDVQVARGAVEASAATFGTIRRPKGLKGRALLAWREWIEPASWLDASRGPAAHAFCELYGEFTERPREFLASKHTQMRAYMAELGLTDERKRGDVAAEKSDEFFGD